MEKFGLVVCGPSGHIGGYTIEEVLQIADDMDDCEQSLTLRVGDIAVEAKLIRDLANRIKELEQAMPKKTLKQKLRSQVRQVNNLRRVEHEQAGITINFELQAMQSVAMGHGLMATLLEAKKVLGEDSEQFKAIESVTQSRISVCLVQLVNMGIPAQVANQRILQGH